MIIHNSQFIIMYADKAVCKTEQQMLIQSHEFGKEVS